MRVATVLLGMTACAAGAGELALVADLNTGGLPLVSGMAGASGGSSIVVGGVRYFAADDGLLGSELWRSDGTAAGTYLLRDIFPGADGSAPTGFEALGGGFCFSADDGVAGRELWCSDGSEAGTHRVADVHSGRAGSDPRGLTAYGTVLLFSANDGTHGREPWASDGTPAGTGLVQDLVPGSAGSDPVPLGRVSRGVLFAAAGESFRSELVLSDGTAAGTGAVESYVEPGLDAATQGDRVYFVDDFYSEIWYSDGTAAGTDNVFLDPLNPLPGGLTSSPAGLLYWDWNTDETERVMWCLDGSFPVELPVAKHTGAPEVGVVSGRTFVTGGGTRQLYFVGCSPDSPRLIGGAGISYSDVRGVTELDNRLYFRATSAPAGAELHRYRGGGAVELIADIRPGGAGSSPSALEPVGARLLMAADDGVHGRELWSFSETDGAALVHDLGVDGTSSRPRVLGVVNDRVVFSAYHQSFGRELFASDGQPSGHRLLADAAPGTADGIVAMDLRHHPAVLHQGHLYYIARTPALGEELWRTDGTAAGTGLVADLCPGSCSGMDRNTVPGSMVSAGPLLFFATWLEGSTGPRLWRSDGTAEGTFALVDGPELRSDGNRPIAALDELVLFAGEGDDGSDGVELWISDGSPSGTLLLRNLDGSPFDSDPDWFTRVGDWIYFVAEDSAGRELWRTDGTPVRTRRVADIRSGSADAHPHHLTAHQGTLYFSADDGSSGYELWRSDGTDAGTWQVADLAAGAASSWPQGLASTSAGLAFAADDGSSGPEPWVSDGTAAGTRRPLSIAPGPHDRLASAFGGDGAKLHRPDALLDRHAGVSDYAAPVEFLDTGDGRVLFRGCDATWGCQLWITDTLLLGTQRLTLFGSGGSSPGHLALLDGAVLFAGTGFGNGRELWRLELPPRPEALFGDGFEPRN